MDFIYAIKKRYGDIFSNNEKLPKVAFCYKHAKEVEEQRMKQTDWEEGTNND